MQALWCVGSTAGTAVTCDASAKQARADIADRRMLLDASDASEDQFLRALLCMPLKISYGHSVTSYAIPALDHALRYSAPDISQSRAWVATGHPPPPRGPIVTPSDWPLIAVCAWCQREETAGMPTEKRSACDLTRSVHICACPWTVLLVKVNAHMNTVPLLAGGHTGRSTRTSAGLSRQSNVFGHYSALFCISTLRDVRDVSITDLSCRWRRLCCARTPSVQYLCSV